MKESLLKSLAAICMVLGLGLIATSALSNETGGDQSRVRGRGKGLPSLGAGCPHPSPCPGGMATPLCEVCPDPGADVLDNQPGTGWTTKNHPCNLTEVGQCGGPQNKSCLERVYWGGNCKADEIQTSTAQ